MKQYITETPSFVFPSSSHSIKFFDTCHESATILDAMNRLVEKNEQESSPLWSLHSNEGNRQQARKRKVKYLAWWWRKTRQRRKWEVSACNFIHKVTRDGLSKQVALHEDLKKTREPATGTPGGRVF